MKTNRRQFIGLFIGGIFAAFFTGRRGGLLSAVAADKKAAKKEDKKTAEVALPAGQTEVAGTDAVATAIGYISDAKKVDKKKYAQYKAGQECSSCALYVASNDGWGKCQMITTGLVKSTGWCASYSKKA